MAIPLAGLTQISNGDALEAVPVDGNFDAIVSHVNTEMIARDGSVAMTGQLTLSADPVSAGDASRKSYVDGLVPTAQDLMPTAVFERTTDTAQSASYAAVSFETESGDADGWWTSGTTLTCPADGVYIIAAEVLSAGTATARIYIGGNNHETISTVTASVAEVSTRYSGSVTKVMRNGQTLQLHTASGGSDNLLNAVLTVTRVALL